MPRMDGMVMAKWLKVSHTDVNILFTSRSSGDTLRSHPISDNSVEFLS